MTYLPLAKTPITLSLLVKVNTGSKANGSCKLINTLSRSFIYVRSCIPSNTDRSTVGNIAILRVSRTRFHLCHFRFKNPWKRKWNTMLLFVLIRIYHECEGGIEKNIPRIIDWHHKACWVMTIGDRQGQIFLFHPHTNNGFFFLLTTYTAFILEKRGKDFLKILNTLRCDMVTSF